MVVGTVWSLVHCLTWWSQADIGKNFGHDQEYLCGYAKEFSSRTANCLLWESMMQFWPQVALEWINVRNEGKSSNLHPSAQDVFKITLSGQLCRWPVGQQPLKNTPILRNSVHKFLSKYSLEKLLWWKKIDACMINGSMLLFHQNSKQKSQTWHIFSHICAFVHAVPSSWDVFHTPHPVPTRPHNPRKSS